MMYLLTCATFICSPPVQTYPSLTFTELKQYLHLYLKANNFNTSQVVMPQFDRKLFAKGK